MISKTPNTFVVGAGPVATALAGGLRLGGVPVLGLWSRSAASARAAGAVAGVAAFSAAPPDLILEADVLILALRDEAVPKVAQTLVATGLVTKHHVMVHCGGSVSSEDALGGVRKSLGGIGTMHPLRAIPDGRTAMREMAGTVFGVEGDEGGRRTALALVEALEGTPLLLEGAKMAAYHAAAALVSNQLIGLLSVAGELFSKAGISEAQAMEALVPLVTGTLGNVAEKGLAEALTGPIRRGDIETVKRHLGVIAEVSPHVSAVYRELGVATVAVARSAPDSDSQALDDIEQLLSGREPQLRTGTGDS